MAFAHAATNPIARLLALAAVGLLSMGSSCELPSRPETTTRYPIVLAHGIVGAETYFGALDYWFGIPEAIEDEGSEVYVTEVNFLDGSESRGEQLLRQVEDLVAQTGASKVNLIGHSQGGIDARYVAGMRPELVASITTIATPHKGAPVADKLADGILADGTLASDLVGDLGWLAPVIELIGGSADPLDARAALDTFTRDGIAAFNSAFPAGVPAGCTNGPASEGGIRFYSWAGDARATNVLDVTDALHVLGGTLFASDEPNDGFVSACSAQFGTVVADDLELNHVDHHNQILGFTSLFEVDPRTLFRDHVRRLADAGL